MNNYEFGIVKSIGENDVILSTGRQDIQVSLTAAEASGLHQVLLKSEQVMVPFDPVKRKLLLGEIEDWTEAGLAELEDEETDEIDKNGYVL